MTQHHTAAAAGACPVDHATSARPEVPHWQGRAGQWSKVPGAARLAWTINFAVSRTALALASRRGDPIARFTTDPALRDDPYPGYEALRAHGPMIRGRLAAASVDHAVCREVFSSPDFGVGGDHKPRPGPLSDAYYAFTATDRLGPVDMPSMLAVDGALHARYRRLVTRAFAARSVAQQEEQVRDVARSLLDDLEASGAERFDLVERFAGLLPIAVIADMLGVSIADRRKILEWGDGAAMLLDPDLSWSQYRGATSDVAQLHRWLAGHVEVLRREPDDSLLGRLVRLEGDDALDPIELRGVALLLLGAGFETTVNLIANGVDLLSRHREQLDAAAEHGWAGVVDETLRFDPPVQLTLRVALRDTEVAGHRLRAGAGFLPMIGGANRDPAVFEDPQRFDVTRANADDHLSLSHGAHYCIGANLAKLEGRIAFESLYERFGDLTVLPGGRRRPNRVLRGWSSLPVGVAATG